VSASQDRNSESFMTTRGKNLRTGVSR